MNLFVLQSGALMRELVLWAILSAASTAGAGAAAGASNGPANDAPDAPTLGGSSATPAAQLDDRDRPRCPSQCYCLSSTQVNIQQRVLLLTRHPFTLRDFNARQMTRTQLYGKTSTNEG